MKRTTREAVADMLGGMLVGSSYQCYGIAEELPILEEFCPIHIYYFYY